MRAGIGPDVAEQAAAREGRGLLRHEWAYRERRREQSVAGKVVGRRCGVGPPDMLNPAGSEARSLGRVQ